MLVSTTPIKVMSENKVFEVLRMADYEEPDLINILQRQGKRLAQLTPQVHLCMDIKRRVHESAEHDK